MPKINKKKEENNGELITEQQAKELAILDECKRQLASCHDLKSVMEIRNRAQAIRSYQKARDDSRESQNSAAVIASFADARAGQLIREGQEKGEIAKEGRGGKHGGRGRKNEKKIDGPKTGPSIPETLKDLGITKNESSRMQLAAEVADKDPKWFDRYQKECNESNRDFTQQAVLRRAKELRREEIGETYVEPPKGKYDVIVIDPPWPMEQTPSLENRPQQSNVGMDYPTLTEDELEAMELPLSDNAHVWVWSTQRFLPMCLRLVSKWGLKYSCLFVWHKSKGMQLPGRPYYNCEFAVYCYKGHPKFATTKNFKTCYEWKRGKHSEKPEEFYEMIRRVTKGKRLDMFSRRSIEGFEVWGNQAATS